MRREAFKTGVYDELKLLTAQYNELFIVLKDIDPDFLDLKYENFTSLPLDQLFKLPNSKTFWELLDIEKYSVITGICMPVVCFHNRGLVHRDIRPDNYRAIKINGNWEIRLGDFEFASKVGFSQGAIQNYYSDFGNQKSFLSQYIVSKLADIYSLGFLFFGLIVTNFNMDLGLYTVGTHFEEVETKLDEFGNVNLKNVILKAIHPVKNNRFISVTEFMFELCKALNL